jgi:hypothetical protein
MRLNENEFQYLISELKKTDVMIEEDMKYIKSAHRQLYNAIQNLRTEEVSLYTNKCLVLKLNNNKLNTFICNKFNEPLQNLYMMHRLIYSVGDFAKKHKDRFTTHKTVSIILSNKFEGGDMYINDEIVSLNELGDYISFNGGNDFHEVKEITAGERDVLIVWFSKKQSKFTLI